VAVQTLLILQVASLIQTDVIPGRDMIVMIR